MLVTLNIWVLLFVLIERMTKICFVNLRNVYTKSNRLLRLFHCYSTDVKIALHVFCSSVLVFIVLSNGHMIRNQLTVS